MVADIDEDFTLIEDPTDALAHEEVNIYAEWGMYLPYPEGSWFVFDELGMDDRLEVAGDSLDEMFDMFEMRPVRILKGSDSEEVLFLGRFDFPQHNKGCKHSDGPLVYDSIGFIDFLCGVSYGDIELLGVVGELSSNPSKITVVSGEGKAAPPVPFSLFDGFEEDHAIFSHMWIDGSFGGGVLRTKALAKNLNGQPKPKNPLFWTRVDVGDGEGLKFPIPGEFLFVAPRIFPNLPWGKQFSTPFLFGGNWMETVYYTNAKVTKVTEPTDLVPYPVYTVKYRKQTIAEVKPTDFADHRVGDRVTILKEVDSTKQSWTWGDLQDFDAGSWVIAPVSFYRESDNGGN